MKAMKGKIHWIGLTEAQTFQEKKISESEDECENFLLFKYEFTIHIVSMEK